LGLDDFVQVVEEGGNDGDVAAEDADKGETFFVRLNLWISSETMGKDSDQR